MATPKTHAAPQNEHLSASACAGGCVEPAVPVCVLSWSQGQAVRGAGAPSVCSSGAAHSQARAPGQGACAHVLSHRRPQGQTPLTERGRLREHGLSPPALLPVPACMLPGCMQTRAVSSLALPPVSLPWAPPDEWCDDSAPSPATTVHGARSTAILQCNAIQLLHLWRGVGHMLLHTIHVCAHLPLTTATCTLTS